MAQHEFSRVLPRPATLNDLDPLVERLKLSMTSGNWAQAAEDANMLVCVAGSLYAVACERFHNDERMN